MDRARLALLKGGVHGAAKGGTAARPGGEFGAVRLKRGAAAGVTRHLDGVVVAGPTKGEALLSEQAEKQGH